MARFAITVNRPEVLPIGTPPFDPLVAFPVPVGGAVLVAAGVELVAAGVEAAEEFGGNDPTPLQPARKMMNRVPGTMSNFGILHLNLGAMFKGLPTSVRGVQVKFVVLAPERTIA